MNSGAMPKHVDNSPLSNQVPRQVTSSDSSSGGDLTHFGITSSIPVSDQSVNEDSHQLDISLSSADVLVSQDHSHLPELEVDPREHLTAYQLAHEITRVLDHPLMADQARNAIDQVLNEYQSQAKMMLIAYTRARVQRLLKLTEVMERMEDELYQEDHINGASVRQLLELTARIQKTIGQIIDLTREMATMEVVIGDKLPDTPGTGNTNIFMFGKHDPDTVDAATSFSRHGRETLRQLFAQLPTVSAMIENKTNQLKSLPVSSER